MNLLQRIATYGTLLTLVWACAPTAPYVPEAKTTNKLSIDVLANAEKLKEREYIVPDEVYLILVGGFPPSSAVTVGEKSPESINNFKEKVNRVFSDMVGYSKYDIQLYQDIFTTAGNIIIPGSANNWLIIFLRCIAE